MHVFSLPNFLGRNYKLFLQARPESLTLDPQNPLFYAKPSPIQGVDSCQYKASFLTKIQLL